MDRHKHIWGKWEISRFSGTPHAKCIAPDPDSDVGCKHITLDHEDVQED